MLPDRSADLALIFEAFGEGDEIRIKERQADFDAMAILSV